MVRGLYSRRVVTALAAVLTLTGQAAAQQPAAPAPPTPPIHEPTNPVLRGFRWRSIGPTSQGARVDDLAVDEKNPSTYYVAYAVSGIIKTVNHGTTFEPIFDTYGTASIADITLAPSDPNIIYVATGEANNRQTTSYGDGMYKSTDAGKTFTNIGLRNTQTLGRVLVHPRDPNTVWVAVGGHLYGGNDERGVYMSTDGGKTWNKTLYVDPYTSATEIVMDPSNANNLWAAMYQRQRTAWGFNGGGPGSGIYNSTDGGRTWKRVTGAGLPRGTMGRVALDFCRSNPNVMYAQIEVAQDREPASATPAEPAAGRGGGGGGGGGGRGGPPAPPNPQSSGVWRSADRGRSWTFQSNENQRPMYFSQIRVDPNHCDVVYLGGVGPTKSTDGGKTWSGLNNMGHVDNHAIWINPANSNHVMYGNDGGIDISWDGGKTWEAVRLDGVALSYHASVDMRRPYYVCTGLQDNGTWCGPSSVRNNNGIKQWMWQSVGGGDGFQTQIDPTDYNIFYTESQNAGINRYDMNTGEVRNIKPNYGGGRGGGGGGAAAVDPGGEAPVQAAPAAGRGNVINPTPDRPLQFNWNNPIRLSPHNPRTIMIGGRSMFISRNRGDTWWQTKPLGKGIDLNQRQIMGVPYSQPSCGGRGGGVRGVPCILSKNDGYVANEFGTITEIAESPIVPGVLWAGTDDGNVQVSQDGGNTWEEVGKNMPGVDHEYYVAGLEASWFEPGTAYAALDGHRHNDLKPYVFKTTDYGKTWTNVTGNLPAFGNLNSIRQDPVNKNLLYAPTELGFYISLDDGKNWHKFMPNLGTGRVDDVVVHPRDNDLILATHSRGVWIMDDVTALQRLTPETLDKPSHLFPVRDAVAWKNDRRIGTATPGDKWWAGENAPRGTVISYLLKNGGGDAKITISDAVTGREFRTHAGTSAAGMNRWVWNLCSTPQPGQAGGGRGGGGGGGGGGCQGGGRVAPEGTYRVVVTVGGFEVGNQVFKVLEDVWLQER